MNYRTATKQQLLAERARLTNAHRKAEQRLGSHTFINPVGGGSTGRNRGSSRAPAHAAERLADQLAQIEAELKRRDGQETGEPGTASLGKAEES